MNKTESAAPRCPGSLKEGFASYNPATIRNVFNRKKVFHVLDEFPIGNLWEKAIFPANDFPEQQWYRMELVKNKLKPSINGEYILKTVNPTGNGMRFQLEQPANEHLCLQLAGRVFNFETLPNALIFFPDGKPAIIYRYRPIMDGFISFQKLFSSKHPNKVLKNYSQVMDLIDQHSAASLVMKERFFRQIIFSWLLTNAIAHVKYSGLVRTERGDYVVAPLNSILCTRLHELCDELALQGGLFEGDKITPEFREYGHYTRNEFSAFARRTGITTARSEKFIDLILSKKQLSLNLIDLAFLPDEAKKIIKFNLSERLERLR